MDFAIPNTLLPFFAALAGVVSLFAVIIALRNVLGRRDEVVDRLGRVVGNDGYGGMGAAIRVEGAAAGSSSEFLGRLLKPFAFLARPRGSEQSRLRRLLIQGGYRSPHAIEIFLGTKIVLAPLVTVGFLQLNARMAEPLAFPMDAVIAVWLCAIAFWTPNFWLRLRIRDRQRNIERSMPDALDLLVTCVEAGQGLDAALHRVANELALAAPILAEELEMTFLEVQAGIPRADGFRRLAERTGVEDLRSLSAMLIQVEMFGSSIARSLRVLAEDMRIRRMHRAEERAATVAVKLTIPLILCILPSLIAIIMGPAVISISRAFGGGTE